MKMKTIFVFFDIAKVHEINISFVSSLGKA